MGRRPPRIERHGVLIDAAVLGRRATSWPRAPGRAGAEARDRRPALQPGQPQADRRDPLRAGLPVKKKTRQRRAPAPTRRCCRSWRPTIRCRRLLLEHRSLSKLKGTYTDKLPLMVSPHTGLVHANCAQAVAVTAHLSSNDPNPEHPHPHARGPSRARPVIRRAATAWSAPTTRRSSCASWHISGRPPAAAFAEGIDVHRATAGRRSLVHRWPRRSSPEQRRIRQASIKLRPDLRILVMQSLGHRAQGRTATTSSATSSYPGVRRRRTRRAQAAERTASTLFTHASIWSTSADAAAWSAPQPPSAAINAMQGKLPDLIKARCWRCRTRSTPRPR